MPETANEVSFALAKSSENTRSQTHFISQNISGLSRKYSSLLQFEILDRNLEIF